MVQTVPTNEQGMPERPGVNGGMMPRMYPSQQPVNYISVESVDKAVAKAERLSFEGLEMDARTREVTKGDEALRLTAKAVGGASAPTASLQRRQRSDAPGSAPTWPQRRMSPPSYVSKTGTPA